VDDAEPSALRSRREILKASVLAVEDPDEVLRLCAALEPDAGDEALVASIAARFDLDEVAAQAVAHLQLTRFTPRRIAQLREELADLERMLDEG
jgi:DNA gyrase/topoisomerase IV subunit A